MTSDEQHMRALGAVQHLQSDSAEKDAIAIIEAISKGNTITREMINSILTGGYADQSHRETVAARLVHKRIDPTLVQTRSKVIQYLFGGVENLPEM